MTGGTGRLPEKGADRLSRPSDPWQCLSVGSCQIPFPASGFAGVQATLHFFGEAAQSGDRWGMKGQTNSFLESVSTSREGRSCH